MLAEVRTLEDVKRIKAMAAAAEAYAKAEKLGDEAIDYAMQIKVRAGRRAGELLIEMAKSGERLSGRGGDRKSTSAREVEKLPSLRVTETQSKRWQDLARIKPAEFERLVRGERPTERKVAAAAKPLPDGWDARSMERRGAFARLCRDMVGLGEPAAVASEFFKHDTTGRLHDGAVAAAAWLGQFLKEWGS